MPPRRSKRLKVPIENSTNCETEVGETEVGEIEVGETEVGETEVGETTVQKEDKVTALQRARIENNRLGAIELRKSKQQAEDQKAVLNKKLKQSVPVEVDTGAGFFIEENGKDGDREEVDYSDLLSKEPFVIAGDGSDTECLECCRPFTLSFLRSKFQMNVCDECRDKETHRLITRTTAKDKYLLKDTDLDKREPVLLFITKKNPRNNYWGEMKLYLESQCHDRAMEIWGSMENIEVEMTKRKILNAKSKSKKYEKKMNELKREVRSSLYKVELAGHTHQWGEETYNEPTDEYTKKCTTCTHSLTYEKM